MSPWKVLGWLLVALLCLLLTAGAYGLALLWGWSLPSVWWLAAIAGAGAGVALIIFLFRTMRDDTHEPAAPLPVELPSERLPRWLLLDGGNCFRTCPAFWKARAARFFPMARRKTRDLSDYGARRTPIGSPLIFPRRTCPANVKATEAKATRPTRLLPFRCGINSSTTRPYAVGCPRPRESSCASARRASPGTGTIPPPSCASGC